MSTQRNERVPSLTLGWRLKMALGQGDVSRAEMAEHLGVEASTVSRWCSDRGAPPKRAYLMQWAFRTDVDLNWLENGDAVGPTPPDDGEKGDQLARLTAAKRARAGNATGHADTARELVAA